MERWATFELSNRSSVPHFNGLATASAMKENKRKYFLLTRAKEETKKSDLKDIHIVGPNFTSFTLIEEFNICYGWLKCIFEYRNVRNLERKFRVLLFCNFVFEYFLLRSALYVYGLYKCLSIKIRQLFCCHAASQQYSY